MPRLAWPRAADPRGSSSPAPWSRRCGTSLGRRLSSALRRFSCACSTCSAGSPRTGRHATCSRRLPEGVQPAHELTAPDPDLAVGQLDPRRRLADLAPPVEGPAGDAAEFIEHLVNGEEFVPLAAHAASAV